MCSIFGYQGNFEVSLLKRSCDILYHRGPDAQGTWSNPKYRIGLAHTRLSIIDLNQNANQPMSDNNRHLQITYNGEIYNYKELRKELEHNGYQFRTHSDTEVILKLYTQMGVDCVKKLIGIFAFAIWDEKNEQLFITRDHFGVKPLYFSQTEKGFLFSSELKALLLESSVSKEINPEAIWHHLSFLWCPTPHTMLKSIQKLEPGHALLIKNNTIQKKWGFYTPPFKNNYTTESESQIIKNIDELLHQAVKRQLVSDVPVGSFLSGGLDSSTLVALAKKSFNKKIECFTINFKGTQSSYEGFSDDYPYAKEVAHYLDVNLHTITIDPSTIYTHLNHMIYHLDEPQADPAPINVGLISKLAKDNNIKVLLSGAGGDDIFTGYRRHLAQDFEKYWAWLPHPIKVLLEKSTYLMPQNTHIGRRYTKLFKDASYSQKERLFRYFLWSNEDTIRPLFSSLYQNQLPANLAMSTLENTLKNIPNETSPINHMLYLEMTHFLTDHNLNYTDKMGMAFGVEIRVPFLDPDLVNYLATVPPHLKIKNHTPKYLLKKTMEKYLPHHIIYRPKTGFGAPLRQWFNQGEFQALITTLLCESNINKRGIFKFSELQKLIEKNKNGHIDASYIILSLMCIETWCQTFIDSNIQCY